MGTVLPTVRLETGHEGPDTAAGSKVGARERARFASIQQRKDRLGVVPITFLANIDRPLAAISVALFEGKAVWPNLTHGQEDKLWRTVRRIPNFFLSAVPPRDVAYPPIPVVWYFRWPDRYWYKGEAMTEQARLWIHRHFGVEFPIVWFDEIELYGG